MSTFNRSIPLWGLCLCLGLLSGQASAEIKMGVVNFQKLLEDAPQTKTAMQALENEFAPRRRELLTLQNDLKARDEKLQKEGAVMSEADRAKAEKTLRDQQREFSRKAGEFQDDAGTRKNEEIGKVQRYLVTEIQAYATAQGYEDALSPASMLSLRLQGGPLTSTQCRRFERSPFAAEAVRLRRWDDAGKVTGRLTPGLGQYWPILRRIADL